MDASLSVIALSAATTFRQLQINSENTMLTLQNSALEQENTQLQSENSNLQTEQQRLSSDNRHLRQQVGDLQRRITAQSNNSSTGNTASSPTSLDVYA